MQRVGAGAIVVGSGGKRWSADWVEQVGRRGGDGAMSGLMFARPLPCGSG